MRKTWVKRENIYYKPFYKQKSKMLFLLIFLIGISFITYQAFSLNQLPSPWNLQQLQQLKQKHKQMMQSLGSKQLDVDFFIGTPPPQNAQESGHADELQSAIKIIRGTRLFDYDAYKPNFEGKFKCLDNSKEIPFDHVNDNYCDCETDGSDEPGTNACANGRFYCKYQKRHITGRGLDVHVHSSRVNDHVCDCCDGSDEWATNSKCLNSCA
ncbi:uncharacterized protein Dwil_GK13088 [Drosophila willistoni]|uniref:Glucosidase II beta subunit N-terminal domain-containing protein n=1 Tax=Drosophila willistoni TaxID=7260 RepID=B4NH38_DROWI|nr:uncharacterized protein LOC6651210 isoform X2 [Drosophila willistoni]EDW84535.1 uncharacterized protein Dwil_GK13088 [Drosophila willistoni]